MTGATFKITHQNPDYCQDMEQAFGIKDSEGKSYREVFFGRESNTGRIYLGIRGNQHTLIAQLDDIARNTLIAFLSSTK